MRRINNYNELIAEQRMLEKKITEQKETLNNSLMNLKANLEPILNWGSPLAVFDKKTAGTSLLTAIVSTGIDLIAGHGLSPKLNWLARLAISLITKKFRTIR
jgi:hypothetical protein